MSLEPINDRPSEAEYPIGTLKIERIFVYICRNADGDEGVCAGIMPSGLFSPLIAADQARLKDLTPMAEAMAARLAPGADILLVEFTARIEHRNIKGATS